MSCWTSWVKSSSGAPHRNGHPISPTSWRSSCWTPLPSSGARKTPRPPTGKRPRPRSSGSACLTWPKSARSYTFSLPSARASSMPTSRPLWSLTSCSLLPAPLGYLPGPCPYPNCQVFGDILLAAGLHLAWLEPKPASFVLSSPWCWRSCSHEEMQRLWSPEAGLGATASAFDLGGLVWASVGRWENMGDYFLSAALLGDWERDKQRNKSKEPAIGFHPEMGRWRWQSNLHGESDQQALTALSATMPFPRVHVQRWTPAWEPRKVLCTHLVWSHHTSGLRHWAGLRRADLGSSEGLALRRLCKPTLASGNDFRRGEVKGEKEKVM